MSDSHCEKNTQETEHKGLYDDNTDPKEHIGEENSYLYIFSQMILISPYHYEIKNNFISV